MHPDFLSRPGLPALACIHDRGEPGNTLPTLVFLGGFRSDMGGTKAEFLARECQRRGQPFLRFDYSGHGRSEGDFADGSIGAWREDAKAILALTEGPLLLAGSSMGGWIALSLASDPAASGRLQGIIGIAAAPDFTQDIYHNRFTPEQRAALDRIGLVMVSGDYDPAPYPVTRTFIEDGERHFILNRAHSFNGPIRLLQGMRDADVPWQMPFHIKKAFPRADTRITLIEDGDHRLSRDGDLHLLDAHIRDLCGLGGVTPSAADTPCTLRLSPDNAAW